MTAPELKPCPFCGGEAERIDIGNDECGNAGGSVIQCAKCMASSRVEFGFKENLIDAWNRRADLAAVQPSTVAALWRANGQPDPHGSRYECERASLPKGDMSDDELANRMFIADRNDLDLIVWQAAAKERIRWLSRALIAAIEPTPDPRDEVIARLVDAAERALEEAVADDMDAWFEGLRAALAAAKDAQA